jgi:hypothetical protein
VGDRRLPPDAARRRDPGEASFEWLEGRRFLIQRATYRHPDIPNALMVVGVAEGELCMHYHDVRGVNRRYGVSLADGTWRSWLDDRSFAQRFTGTRRLRGPRGQSTTAPPPAVRIASATSTGVETCPPGQVHIGAGARVRTTMRDPRRGEGHGGAGRFTPTDPPHRLSFTRTRDDDPTTRQLIEVDFTDHGEHTTVRLANRQVPATDRDDHVLGSQNSFDNLEAALTT